MTIQLAGPMAGYPDLNRPAFDKAASELRAAGHTVINPHDVPPHEHEGQCPRSYAVSDSGHSAACHLRTCLISLLGCAELHLLKGWSASRGTGVELLTARESGLVVTFAADAEAPPSHS